MSTACAIIAYTGMTWLGGDCRVGYYGIEKEDSHKHDHHCRRRLNEMLDENVDAELGVEGATWAPRRGLLFANANCYESPPYCEDTTTTTTTTYTGNSTAA